MNKLIIFECNKNNIEKCTHAIHETLQNLSWIELITRNTRKEFISDKVLPSEPGVVIHSGGSTGQGYQCFHTFQNLNQSALATGQWLQEQGIEPKACSYLNSLPINHVSGFMPWWRSQCWNSKHTWIKPSLMKDPIALENTFRDFFRQEHNPVLMSLVPTQLHRLIAHPAGIKWLQSFTLIWIGGAYLSTELAKKARNNNINLAPCYGTTETAAMVSVLKPDEFLSGRNDCGEPLKDVSLRVNKNSILEIKTSRLAIGRWRNGNLEKITDDAGWWESSDYADIQKLNHLLILGILGRKDTAINSGGEIIYPEILEERLLTSAKSAKLPIKNLLFLPINDEEWGNRIIALVKLENNRQKKESREIIIKLKELVQAWLPSERPRVWKECPELAINKIGKWERKKWEAWIQNNQ